MFLLVGKKSVKPKKELFASKTKAKNLKTKAKDHELVNKASTDLVSKKSIMDKVEFAPSLKKRGPGDGQIYFSDHFSGNVPDSAYLKFPDSAADCYKIEGGRLAISAISGQDLWGGVPLKRGAPLLLYPASLGNYGVECKVDATWGGVAQRLNTQVGLFVFENVENWLFVGFTHHSNQQGASPQFGGLITTSTLADNSKIEHLQSFPPMKSATLGIERAGDYWLFFIKLIDGSWSQIGPKVHAHFGNHWVGMGVKSFQWGGSPQKGYFDNFIIRTI